MKSTMFLPDYGILNWNKDCPILVYANFAKADVYLWPVCAARIGTCSAVGSRLGSGLELERA